MLGKSKPSAAPTPPWWLHTGQSRLEGATRIVAQAWQHRVGPAILATTCADGQPNVIYTQFIRRYNDTVFVIADNKMNKTYANIVAGSGGAILFLTQAGLSYQVKGRLEYHQNGEYFQNMRTWNPPTLSGRAAVTLRVEHVFSGGEQLC